ncbi:hypothetical protein DFH08DRAFT_383451 [Mycena albidolilacea]|uniref:Uncharacterized protein n=1 Tax=Mycena albidolilacea TaxID=1033008 RepID=A0AAD7EH32_9AGAR|nr:hypothetical protein DFH08DRAFT_383451 [Mycena albidolilacea]
MECRPEMGRPSAGAYWLSPAMLVAVLKFVLRLIGLWSIWMVWVGMGLWFWPRFWFDDAVIEGVVGWIRRRGRKECHIKTILIVFATLGGALVTLLNLLLSCRHSASLNWIAAYIYFVWSPELMCIGLVVFVVGRWISAFMHAH